MIEVLNAMFQFPNVPQHPAGRAGTQPSAACDRATAPSPKNESNGSVCKFIDQIYTTMRIYIYIYVYIYANITKWCFTHGWIKMLWNHHPNKDNTLGHMVNMLPSTTPVKGLWKPDSQTRFNGMQTTSPRKNGCWTSKWPMCAGQKVKKSWDGVDTNGHKMGKSAMKETNQQTKHDYD